MALNLAYEIADDVSYLFFNHELRPGLQSHYSKLGTTERVDLNLRTNPNSCDEKVAGFVALSCCSGPISLLSLSQTYRSTGMGQE